VINRGNARAEVFHEDEDLEAFVRIMGEASIRVPMRVVAYCLMTNHFYLVLWPRADGDLSRWMHWLLTTHVRRYLGHYRHSGHVWQGRFKAFPIQQDEHLLTVVRYVERNPRGPDSWSVPRTGAGRASGPMPKSRPLTRDLLLAGPTGWSSSTPR
jgi:putative transposase